MFLRYFFIILYILILLGFLYELRRNNIPNSILVIALLFGLGLLVFYLRKQQQQNKEDEPEQALEMEQEQPPRLLLFYADWCGYCQKFKPEWEQIVETLKDTPIDAVAINGDENPDLVKQLNVPGFPFIIVESGNGQMFPYEGERNADAVLHFLFHGQN